jgi:hypothetical protein
MKHHLLILIFFLAAYDGMAIQPYSLKLHFKNQKVYSIVFQSITGDQFAIVDTLNKDGIYRFREGLSTGMYRLLFKRILKGKAINEPNQQLDFIFNNEDIEFSTDIDSPTDSLKVILSEENRVWLGFKRKDIEVQKLIKELDIEIDFFRKHGIIDPAARNEYNQLQIIRNESIDQISKDYPGLFASKLIAYYREPVLDGALPKEERKVIFKSDFFNGIDFNDETLINSSVYTDKVYKYLSSFNQRGLTPEQQQNEYIIAIDQIMAHCSQNEKVRDFIHNYLVRYFKRFDYVKLDSLLLHK